MKDVVRAALFLAMLCTVTADGVSSVEVGKPEDVGLSTERLLRIHETIQRYIDAGEISGAVTLVARAGRIAHFEAHGLMDLQTKKPMAKDAVFRIASMTKPVTAIAVLMLIEEGRIRLTDPVSKFIPEFKNTKVAVLQERAPGQAATPNPAGVYSVPADREITIKDLLTHVSGLVSGAISAREASQIVRMGTLADYVPLLARIPLEFQPGSRWSYSASGAGFDTLSRVVEIISGQSFDQFLRQRVFEPLGMKDTSFVAGDRLSRLPTVYQKTGGGLQPPRNLNDVTATSYFSGANGLLSTAEDWAHFCQMLLDGGQLNGTRLLSPRTVELMSAVHVPDTMAGRPRGRGFGLSVQVVTDALAANLRVSDGSYAWDGAFGTHFWIDPKEKIVSILMVHTPNLEVLRDFDNAVMQAIVQ